jgi:arginine deiminase
MAEPRQQRLEVRIESEIAPLEHVLVHRPGDEVERMTQHELEELLFDDILAADEAMIEHDLMTEILSGNGAEVMDVLELLEAALERSSKRARRGLISDVCELHGTSDLIEVLEDFEAKTLARALVCGLRWQELDAGAMTLKRLHNRVFDSGRFALAPQPNLMFMRDPCVAVSNHVVVGRMATLARAREPLLVAFAIEHGGAVDASQLAIDERNASRHPSYRRFEGGDCLVIGPHLLLIGCGQRTSPQTIERVSNLLFDELDGLERVYALMMPSARSIMHLDTILTQIDEKLFLGHAPLVAGANALKVARLERGKPPELISGSLLDVLREELGSDVQLVPCGGDDPLHQEREQWTDGANAFCMSPGHIVLYARNVRTTAALQAHGFETVGLHMVQSPEERAERITEGAKHQRAVFSFPGSELSRARGGGRCLTMPLRRR